MALQPPQLQFDLVNATYFSARKILDVLEACAEDDIQGLAIFPLEAFGALLFVDRDQVSKGEDALKRTQSKLVSFLKLVIGLSDRGMAKALRGNIHLTAAFLFAVACSPGFTVEETGRLIYEMMAIKGILKSYPIHSTPLSQFVRTVIGYGDMIEGESPFELYSNLGRAITERLGNADAFPGLFTTSPIDKLAKILHKVFEELQNMDNRRITMEGWRTGLWLATVFLWLRPTETDLSLDGYRIFPQISTTEVRLSINLVRSPTGADISQWCIHPWHPEQDLEKMVESMEIMVQEEEPHHHYPLKVAKAQMSNSGTTAQVLEETGYLAAALVDVAFEMGHLCNKDGSLSLPLKDICSDFFQSSHHTIMEGFGWDKLCNTRQNKIAEALKGQISRARKGRPLTDEYGLDDVSMIGSEVYDCNKHYHDTHGQSILAIDDGRLNEAVERAIHLAVEALLFSFCFKRPAREIYRPHTTNRLRSHAKILRGLIFGHATGASRTASQIQGYPFWEFRVQALQSMLQGATDVDPSDIAIASNGYVGFSAALLEMNTNMTDRRKVSAICIVPGALRLEGEQGRFDKIIEAKPSYVLSSRNLVTRPPPVELFSPDFTLRGVDDREALDKLGTKVEHLTSAYDDPFRRRIVYLTTFLHPILEASRSPLLSHVQVEPPVSTSWKQSIDAIAFATHVLEHNMSPAQERSLAERWREKGYVGSDNIQWCLVGQAAGPSRRYISATSSNEQLRFFEAGNLTDGRKLFIRQKQVPLMQCIKEAIDLCGADPNWAIIS